MGERQLDKLEVTGSSPVTPISGRHERVQFSEFIAGGRFDVSDVLDPLVDSFKQEHGLD